MAHVFGLSSWIVADFSIWSCDNGPESTGLQKLFVPVRRAVTQAAKATANASLNLYIQLTEADT